MDYGDEHIKDPIADHAADQAGDDAHWEEDHAAAMDNVLSDKLDAELVSDSARLSHR